jgi:transcriptional regulator with XRE-family HTH domain
MTKTDKNLGWIHNLRLLMESAGFNPRSLSLKAGLNATAVRDMLEGRTKFPRYDTVMALAAALETTPAGLMGGPLNINQDNKLVAEDDPEIDLLTEIIARLQEAAEEHRKKLSPQDFAAMVATIYRQVRQDPHKARYAKTIKPKIVDLLEYENLRQRRKQA